MILFRKHPAVEPQDGAAALAAALAQEIAADASSAVQAHAVRLHAAAVARRTMDDDGRRATAAVAARAATAALVALPQVPAPRRARLRIVSTAHVPVDGSPERD